MGDFSMSVRSVLILLCLAFLSFAPGVNAETYYFPWGPAGEQDPPRCPEDLYLGYCCVCPEPWHSYTGYMATTISQTKDNVVSYERDEGYGNLGVYDVRCEPMHEHPPHQFTIEQGTSKTKSHTWTGGVSFGWVVALTNGFITDANCEYSNTTAYTCSYAIAKTYSIEMTTPAGTEAKHWLQWFVERSKWEGPRKWHCKGHWNPADQNCSTVHITQCGWVEIVTKERSVYLESEVEILREGCKLCEADGCRCNGQNSCRNLGCSHCELF